MNTQHHYFDLLPLPTTSRSTPPVDFERCMDTACMDLSSSMEANVSNNELQDTLDTNSLQFSPPTGEDAEYFPPPRTSTPYPRPPIMSDYFPDTAVTNGFHFRPVMTKDGQPIQPVPEFLMLAEQMSLQDRHTWFTDLLSSENGKRFSQQHCSVDVAVHIVMTVVTNYLALHRDNSMRPPRVNFGNHTFGDPLRTLPVCPCLASAMLHHFYAIPGISTHYPMGLHGAAHQCACRQAQNSPAYITLKPPTPTARLRHPVTQPFEVTPILTPTSFFPSTLDVLRNNTNESFARQIAARTATAAHDKTLKTLAATTTAVTKAKTSAALVQHEDFSNENFDNTNDAFVQDDIIDIETIPETVTDQLHQKNLRDARNLWESLQETEREMAAAVTRIQDIDRAEQELIDSMDNCYAEGAQDILNDASARTHMIALRTTHAEQVVALRQQRNSTLAHDNHSESDFDEDLFFEVTQ